MFDSRFNPRNHWSGVLPLLAGILATALVATGGVPTNASPLTAHSSAALAAERPVLSSDYGKATSRVEGTFGKAGTVTGTFTPRRFQTTPAGNLKAVGKLTTTLTKGNGTEVGTDSQRVALPVQSIEGQDLKTVAAAAATGCDILNLVLGPLDLDVLGLQVHLDTVVLDITAVPGAGNLLGNLLCAVAGLLDNTGVLTQIQQILASILAILKI